MVGHGEGHLLLKDPTRVGIKLFRDINPTGDGTSSMDLGPQLVCLSDLQSQGTHYIMSVVTSTSSNKRMQQWYALNHALRACPVQTKMLGESWYMKAVLLMQADITVQKEAMFHSSLPT